MRMPTRLGNGEGRVSGEAIDTGTRLDLPGYGARHVGRVMRVIGGDPSRLGLASPTVAQAAGRTGVGEGHTTGEAGSCWRRKGPLLLVRCGGSRGSVIGDEPGTPLRIRTLLKKLYPAAKTDADRCCWARLPSPTASAARTALGAPPCAARWNESENRMRGAIGEADASLPVQVWSVQSLASRTGASLAGGAATRRSKRRQRLDGVWDRLPK